MKIVLFCLYAWVVFVAIIFGTLFDYFSSEFYSFGPSPTLYIVGINFLVDTWPKYIWLCIYVMCQSFIISFAGDIIYPWINAVVLNTQATYIEIPKVEAFFIVNGMYLVFNLFTLFSIGISMSQLGFFICSTIGSTLAGAIISGKCIKKKVIKQEGIA